MGIFVVKWVDSDDSLTGSSDDSQSEPSDSTSTQMGVRLNLAARHSNIKDIKTRKIHNKKAKYCKPPVGRKRSQGKIYKNSAHVEKLLEEFGKDRIVKLSSKDLGQCVRKSLRDSA